MERKLVGKEEREFVKQIFLTSFFGRISTNFFDDVKAPSESADPVNMACMIVRKERSTAKRYSSSLSCYLSFIMINFNCQRFYKKILIFAQTKFLKKLLKTINKIKQIVPSSLLLHVPLSVRIGKRGRHR